MELGTNLDTGKRKRRVEKHKTITRFSREVYQNNKVQLRGMDKSFREFYVNREDVKTT